MMDACTAAKWWWRGDAGWVAYDDAMNLKLENEYQQGVLRIKVDKERFVDVGLTQKDIRQKWYCSDAEDKAVIGLQRRYDDETKRRAVKREVPPIFKSVTLALLNYSNSAYNKLERILKDYKASVRQEVTKRTKVVVVSTVPPTADKTDAADEFDEDEDEDEKDEEPDEEQLKVALETQLDLAQQYQVPVVTADWLEDCIAQGSFLSEPEDLQRFAMPEKSGKKRTAEEADLEDIAQADLNPATSDDINDVQQPALKKQKVVDAPDTVQSSDSTITESTITKLLQSKQWVGLCSYPADNGHFPFHIIFKSRNGNSVEGTLKWPTLKNALTKFKGTVQGANFTFTEFEVVHGAEYVEIGSRYDAILDGDSFSGSVYAAGEVEAVAQFQGDIYIPDEAEEEEEEEVANAGTNNNHIGASLLPPQLFSVNSTYSGKCTAEYTFDLHINSRKGNEIEGTISWPAFKCSTKMKGAINGDTIKFEEYAVEKLDLQGQEPELPMKYEGNLVEADPAASLDGKATTPVAAGKYGIIPDGGTFTIFFGPHASSVP